VYVETIDSKLAEHEVGTPLTAIDGIGAQTAARLIADLGDLAHGRSPGTLVSCVGVAVVPALKQMG